MPYIEAPRPHLLGISTGADDLRVLQEYEQRNRVVVHIFNDLPGGLVDFVRIRNLDLIILNGVLLVETSHSLLELEFAKTVLRARGIRLFGVTVGRLA